MWKAPVRYEKAWLSGVDGGVAEDWRRRMLSREMGYAPRKVRCKLKVGKAGTSGPVNEPQIIF